MNILKVAHYQLYLLQLESYEVGRFLKLLWKKGAWPKGHQRKQLVWTGKALLLFFVSELLAAVIAGILAWRVYGAILENVAASAIVFFAAFAIFQFVFFIFLPVGLLIVAPFDFAAKFIVVSRAKSKLANIPSLKIIGIAGSYGKTTMKEVLKSVLSTKFRVLSTPESVNTPIGIARWILKNVDASVEILIVEMGEHYKGDIEQLCQLTPPDISVVTGINQAHLERMKNMDTIVETIFEIISGTKAGGLVVLNGNDARVMGHYKEFIWPDHKIEKYAIEDFSNNAFHPETLQWQGHLAGAGELKINLLARYALGVVSAAVKISKSLGLSLEEIKKGVESIRPVEHRLQPMRSGGDVLVIDDSYNGNPDGVREAIEALSFFTQRRKVFITPGLVETGKEFKEIHLEIGRQLAGVANVVILIKNSVTGWIEQGVNEGMTSHKNNRVEIVWFETTQEAHAALKDILKPNDVILFQNDWGDQYI